MARTRAESRIEEINKSLASMQEVLDDPRTLPKERITAITHRDKFWREKRNLLENPFPFGLDDEVIDITQTD